MSTEERYLISLLQNPIESDKTEYKSAVKFQENNDFALKLVKHILGFANSGGGHIVIGYTEDQKSGALIIDGNLSDEVSSSYEVTRLSQRVNSILGTQDRIELVISKVTHKDKLFPMIYVSPFKRRPYFCKKDYELSNGNKVLEEGAIYIRVPGAQTVKVAGAGDWDRLIAKCVEAEYDIFINRARDLFSTSIAEVQKGKASNTAKDRLSAARERFKTKFKDL